MGTQINFKIAGYVDLDMLHMFFENLMKPEAPRSL
jgi:hypothetical protein